MPFILKNKYDKAEGIPISLGHLAICIVLPSPKEKVG